jgi:pantothenate kinase-related protein Tda10
MDQLKMPATIRLTNAEQEAIRQKCIEINKLLVKRGMPPIRDSELVHKILEKSVPCVQINASGDVVIETE